MAPDPAGSTVPVGTASTPSPHTGLTRSVRADYAFLRSQHARYDSRYEGAIRPASVRGFVRDLVTNVGFQQLTWFRVAQHLGRRRATTPLAMVGSRLLRHVYGAEMHYQAQIAPGVALIHGNGIVISREAVVGEGCIIFQNVTLGISSSPEHGEDGGAPRLGTGVHVGPGASILGPVEIGDGTKIAANAVVMRSVPPNTAVLAPEPTFTSRRRRPGPPT